MKTLFLIICALSFNALADFKENDRVFDSRNYVTGTVIRVLDNNSYEVKYDVGQKTRVYNNYYSAELGPQILTNCDSHHFLCVNQNFKYTMPLFGHDRTGTVHEIFQSSDGKIVYGVMLENENRIRFLNSDHQQFMVPQPMN